MPAGAEARDTKRQYAISLVSNAWQKRFRENASTSLTRQEHETGEVVMLALRGLRGRVDSLAFSADGFTLASASSYSPCARLWDLRTGKRRAVLDLNPDSSISGLAFAPDGDVLA